MNLFDLMIKISTDTTGVEKGINETKSKMSGLTKALGGGLAKAAKVGIAAVTAATAAAGAFAVSAIKVGENFDKSMSQVAATMGDKADEMVKYNGQTVSSMEALRDFAQEMGRTTAFSATQAADALNYMALAGYDAQTSMDMLPNVLNLAAAGSMDLARASDMITDTQTAFGITLERTTQMVDEMAKAASTGNTSVEQLGDAFLTVGGLAKELNGGMVTLSDGTTQSVDGVQELEIALTAMANAGVKGSEAGTHMRNMLMKLSSPTSEGAAQMEALGVSVFDAEGNMRSLHDIMGDLNGALGDLTQEQKIQAISDLFNARDLASAEALLGAVEQDWDGIGESILNAEGAASKMAETQLDNLAGDVTLFKSALEGAQIAISDVLSPALREFVQFGTDGLSKLTGAFKTGGLSGAMEVFGSLLSDGLNMIIAKLPSFIDAGMQLLSALGQGILDNLPVLIDAAVQIIQMLVTGIVEALPALVEGALQIVVGLANGISEMLPELIPTIVEVMLTIVQTLIDNIDLLVDAALQLMIALADGFIQAMPIFLEKVPLMFGQLFSAIMENLPLILQAGMQILSMLATGVINNLPLLLSYTVNCIMQTVQAIGSHLPEFLQKGIELIGQLAAGLIRAIPKIIAAIPQIIQSIKNPFDSFDWASIGINLIKGIASGVANAAVNLARSALDAVKNTFSTVTGWLGINSPSKRARDVIGKGISEGIEVGFVKDMKRTSKSMVDSMSDAFDEIDGELSPTLGIADDSGYTVIDTDDGAVSGGTFAPVINVYGSEGQDVNELANIVMDKLSLAYRRKKVSYAY